MPNAGVSLVALLVLLGACSNTLTPADGTPPSAPTPASTALAAPGVTGRWSSPGCGARTYERRLELDTSGSFTAEDRVSPCPPGTACVWSGIVLTRGSYAVAGGEIRLTFDGARGAARELPRTLAIDPATSAPVEALDGTRCVYTRLSP